MSYVVKQAAIIGVMGLAASITLTTSASAAVESSAVLATWSSAAPTNASSVTTPSSASVRVSSSGSKDGTVQIRKGKYNGKWYVWGRVASPTSKLNKGYELQFSVGGGGSGCSGTKIKDINKTTYTAAAQLNSKCKYFASVVNTSSRNLLGSTSYEP